MNSPLRSRSPMLCLFTSLLVSMITVPSAFAVQPMTNESALGVGGKGKFGIGVGTGSFEAFSIYKETNDFNFVQLSGNLRSDGGYIGTVDYCERFTGARLLSNAVPYAGIGIVSLNQTDSSMIGQVAVDEKSPRDSGIRLPFGINFDIPMAPIQIGAEIAPSLIVAPKTVTYIQGMIGARIMF